VAGVLRLARQPQRTPPAGQGRDPLRPRGRPGRSRSAGHAHDLQVRRRGRAVRWREGRPAHRPTGIHRGGDRDHHPAFHHRAGPAGLHQPQSQRAGARHGNRRARDGMDRRHLPHVAPRRHRCRGVRHRKAGRVRWHPRTRRGHGPRRAVRGPRPVPACGGRQGGRAQREARGQAGHRAGTWQRGLPRCQVPRGRRRHQDRRHHRTRRCPRE
jgi:hypothetical protein